MDNQTRQFGFGDPTPSRPGRPQQYFPDPQAQSGYYEEPEYSAPEYSAPEPRRSNTAAIVLGLLSAILAVASVVLFFLWRSAAEEANKPPVTVTQTTTATSTVTTTRRPFDFGQRQNESPNPNPNPAEPQPTAVQPPAPQLPDVNIEDFLNRLDGFIENPESVLPQ